MRATRENQGLQWVVRAGGGYHLSAARRRRDYRRGRLLGADAPDVFLPVLNEGKSANRAEATQRAALPNPGRTDHKLKLMYRPMYARGKLDPLQVRLIRKRVRSGREKGKGVMRQLTIRVGRGKDTNLPRADRRPGR
jgi:hypothetical protein